MQLFSRHSKQFRQLIKPLKLKSLKLKSLKQRWLLLLLAGLFGMSIAFLIARAELPAPHPQPSPIASIAPRSPHSSPTASSPAASPHTTAPSPVATRPPTKTAPSSSVSKQQQAAINQRGMQELQASLAIVDTAIEMHVAIAEGVPALAIGTTTTAEVLHQDGHTLHSLTANTPYTVQPDGEGIRFGAWHLPAIVWLNLPNDGLFSLGDRSYRGQLLLVAEGGRLWAVNYIDMRRYLRGVVPSEVSPSWEVEALKAQSIAARSYALVHYFRPATSLYHLGATEYYQVYTGIEKEDDRTNGAIDATSGEFVSYHGGVVESLYAASDEIVAEAFQGRGMSQLGALSLARQGYTYHQILSNYYPSTGVSRIQLDQE